MALRNIRTEEDPILRKKSRLVEKIDEKIVTLVKDMAETMYEAENGVGLAAPQVGILKRIVVIDIGEGLNVFINPVILESSGSGVDIEGCLSIPGRQGEVERPTKVKVKAMNEKGEEFTMEAEDFMARAVCHELDHLDGILFIDKLVRSED
ncbi:peptide deformylase [Clostridium oryzae]|uniref:Peptide deformylase n=1 Tax=Clostridium oryzae TaxID=1450648 RepID=A0A1V4IPN3_9CLOT|nr:peptide deformylase [Clostridium oryzae]OPJ61755.1 peptide deformylase [Clostridium oryzae]